MKSADYWPRALLFWALFLLLASWGWLEMVK